MKNSFRFIYKNSEEFIGGEVKDNKLYRYYDFSKEIVGNIYRAKVINYIKSLDSFVVDIGEYKNAILKKNKRFEDVKNGDIIIVEILSVPEDNKLIEVSQKISLANKFIVLVPHVNSNSDRFIKDYRFTFFKRSKGSDLTKEELKSQYDFLEKEYLKILNQINYLPEIKLIRENNLSRYFFDEYEGNKLSNIEIESVTKIDYKFNPRYNKIISQGIKEIDLREIEFNLGNIVVDKLEALTVIDVNSGHNLQDLNKDEMSYKVNIDSLDAIIRSILLKNIKKILFIDFIRMNQKDKKRLIKEFENKLKQEKIKFNILGFTKLELLEMVIF